jgi:hypothetical protein
MYEEMLQWIKPPPSPELSEKKLPDMNGPSGIKPILK